MVILEGAILGGFSAAGFGLTYTRLPEPVKKFVTDHPLMTDIALTTATYHVLGGTLTALFAAGFMSILISLLLFVPRTSAWLQETLTKLKEWFISLFHKRQLISV
jgi:hypothetical protein